MVSSRLSIVEKFPHLKRVPRIRAYQHWAIEVGGRYYELHRGEWKDGQISTEHTMHSIPKRKNVHRVMIGYTHYSDADLVREGMLGFLLKYRHPILSYSLACPMQFCIPTLLMFLLIKY